MNTDLATQYALDRLHQVGFSHLTEEERTLAAIWGFDSKVANGGFEHYYELPEADLAFYAPTAFRAIGADDMAQIAEQANSVFGPGGPPRVREERRKALRELKPESKSLFDQLESRYFEYPNDLAPAIEEYLNRGRDPA